MWSEVAIGINLWDNFLAFSDPNICIIFFFSVTDNAIMTADKYVFNFERVP